MTNRAGARWTGSRVRSVAFDVALAAILVVVTFWHLLPSVTSTPFHRDEARWVHRISYLSMWQEPFGDHWQDEGYDVGTGSWDEYYRMRAQPPLAPYVLGIGHLLQGRDLQTNGYWIMDFDEAWNTEQGNMPTVDDLHTARRTNIGVAALTAIVVYLLGKRLTNRVGGVIGALVLIFHPLVHDTSTRAMSDPTFMLTIALAALAAARFAERPTWVRAGLLGVALGLGGAAKLSPLALGAAFVLIALLVFARRLVPLWMAKSRPSSRFAWQLLSVPLISVATFVLSYPYLWPHPIRNTYRLFAFRADSFALQISAFPQTEVTGFSNLVQRLDDELGRRLSLTRWISRQIESGLGWTLPDSWNIERLDIVLALIGCLLIVGLVLRQGIFGPRAMIAVVLFGQTAIILAAMDVQFARYLLPIVLAMAVCIGSVGGVSWNALGWVRARFAPARDSATAHPVRPLQPTHDAAPSNSMD